VNLALALLLVASLAGREPSRGQTRIAEAIARQCEDSWCTAEAVVWGYAESNLSRHPIAESPDAKAGSSCGIWQTPCALTRDDVDSQVRLWLRMRAQSLGACGDLTALASGQCGRATELVAARRQEAAALLLAAEWAR
jgi:hypothetical protein